MNDFDYVGESKMFDAQQLLSDLRNYKERTEQIHWVDPLWIAKMEAQFAAERAEEGLGDDD